MKQARTFSGRAARWWLAGWLVAACASVASAFPGWMGVYGATQRHDGGVPGTFTVLMNQDYYGLNAEVGVQVNGGAWAQYRMAYAGRVDGNSKWVFTPAAAFPAGATVQFYFHGFDNWGGHIWDSRSGQNYAFVAPGSSDGLVFGAAQALGAVGPSGWMDDACARTGRLFALAGSKLNIGAVAGGGAAWTGWFQGPATSRVVAATASRVVAVGHAASFLLVSRSADGGGSWSSPVPLAVPAVPVSYDIAARGDSEFLIVCSATPSENGYPYDARLLYAFRSSDNGATWSAPILVKSETMGWFDSIEVEANAAAFFAKFRYTQQAYASSVGVARSADGVAWTTDYLFGDKIAYFSALAVGPEGAYVAMDPYYDQATRFARFLGSAWEKLSIPHAGYEGGRGVKLARDARGDLLFLRVEAWPNANWSIAKSRDRGATWYATGTLVPPADGTNAAPTLRQVLNDGARLHLAWSGVGGNFWQVQQPRAGGPVQWIGGTYHWPLNGSIRPTDDLWVNVETYPAGHAVAARVIYSTDGMTWRWADLDLEVQAGNNDRWHVNLGRFPAGATVRYAVMARGGDGAEQWDNNRGQDFRATVQP